MSSGESACGSEAPPTASALHGAHQRLKSPLEGLRLDAAVDIGGHNMRRDVRARGVGIACRWEQ